MCKDWVQPAEHVRCCEGLAHSIVLRGDLCEAYVSVRTQLNSTQLKSTQINELSWGAAVLTSRWRGAQQSPPTDHTALRRPGEIGVCANLQTF